MPKYEVNISYPIVAYRCHELEVEASSEEEAEQKAMEYVQNGECEGVTELEEPYYDDMQAYCEGNRPCEYEVYANEIEEKETSHD